MRAPRRTGATAVSVVALGLGIAAAVATGQDQQPGAQAVGSAVATGQARAVAFSTGSGAHGVATQRGPGSDSVAATGSGAAQGTGQVSATVTAKASSASVTARGVSLFDGLVTARSVSESVRAPQGGQASFHGKVTGLMALGRRMPTSPGTYLVGNYGSVTVLGRGTALRVDLRNAYNRYTAGSSASVAVVSATAPPAAKPKPDHSRTTTTTTTPSTTRGATPPPSSSSGGGSSGGSSAPESPSSSSPATPKAKKPAKKKPAKPKVKLTGSGYTFPVLSKEARVADNFGAAREIGAHQGDDIFAPFGTPIVAVHDGTIEQVGTLKISGNRLWLKTATGPAFFYCHLSAFAPAAVDGNHVKAGTVLGFVGNTGDAEPTPPHLHFEIHPTGTEDTGAVDPFRILTSWQNHEDVPVGAWASDTAQRPGTLVQVRDYLADR